MLRAVCAGVLVLSMIPAPGLSMPAQDEIGPAIVGRAMPDFSLPDLSGEEISISGLKGRNILLVFPRGKVSDHWCQLCHYQYAELADLEEKEGIRRRYDLEIIFVLPYGREEVAAWIEMFPRQMEVIEGWKHPDESQKDNERVQRWAEYTRKYYPKTFSYEDGRVPAPFPVLVDDERVVSKGLDLFRTEWDRSEVDQNVSTIFMIDREGVVRFKYFSQSTLDRPPLDYLLTIMDCVFE